MSELSVGSQTFSVDVEELIEYVERYASVQNGQGPGIVPAMLTDWQLEAARSSLAIRLERDITVTIKARQVGSSTLWLLLIAALMAKYPGFRVLWVSQDEQNAKSIRNKWDIIVRSLHSNPNAFFPSKRRDNESEYTLSNGSSIVWAFSGNTEDAANRVGRGDTIHLAVFTELAYWQYPESTINSLMPGLEHSGVSIIMDSTANGTDGQGAVFYKYAKRAMEGDPDMTLLFCPWYKDRRYRDQIEPEVVEAILSSEDSDEQYLMSQGVTPEQIAWRRRKIKDHGSAFFEIYPEDPNQAFISGDGSVFDASLLARIAKRIRTRSLKPPLSYESFAHLDPAEKRPRRDLLAVTRWLAPEGELGEGYVRIWDLPDESKGPYVLGVDAAQGTRNGDWQSGVLLDREAQIAGFIRTRTNIPRFADLCQRVALMFDAWVLVEDEDSGSSVVQRMSEWQSGHLMVKYDVSDVILKEFTKMAVTPDTKRLGLLNSNKKTRPMIISHILDLIGGGFTEINDENIYLEMATFEDNGEGRVEHADGCYDDGLLAFGTAAEGRRVILQSGKSLIRSVELRRVERGGKYDHYLKGSGIQDGSGRAASRGVRGSPSSKIARAARKRVKVPRASLGRRNTGDRWR